MDGTIPAQPNPGTGAQPVVVKFGVYNEKMPAGTTVAQARERLGKVAQMQGDTVPYINGNKVDENAQLDGGQTLQFMKRTGEKGIVFEG